MNYDHAVRVQRVNFTTERTLVVSDIHGSATLLRSLLKELNYTPDIDTLVILGDMLQKSPENLETLHLIMELSKRKNVFVLLGNNDLFAMEGTDEELFEHCCYFKQTSVLGEMLTAMGKPFPRSVEETYALRAEAERFYKKEFDFISGLPHVLETDKFLFAHAGLTSEALDEQELSYVLYAPRFTQNSAHKFSKLLVVGHWPVSLFHNERLTCTPHYNAEKNILSIDGGNSVKLTGCLNGVVLNNRTAEWTSKSVDKFTKIPAPCTQTGERGAVICWPDNEVKLLKDRGEFSLCLCPNNNDELEIPTELLYEQDGALYTNDITSARLSVNKGEQISLIREYSDRLLIMKNAEVGWLFLS